MSAIESFRTAALGGHVARCEDCAHTRIAYNSCRNRHCPKCQGAAARELLERGAVSIQSVCSEIGYNDVAFFRSLFKRHTGMTPAEYRNRFSQMSFDRGELASGRPVA